MFSPLPPYGLHRFSMKILIFFPKVMELFCSQESDTYQSRVSKSLFIPLKKWGLLIFHLSAGWSVDKSVGTPSFAHSISNTQRIQLIVTRQSVPRHGRDHSQNIDTSRAGQYWSYSVNVLFFEKSIFSTKFMGKLYNDYQQESLYYGSKFSIYVHICVFGLLYTYQL